MVGKGMIPLPTRSDGTECRASQTAFRGPHTFRGPRVVLKFARSISWPKFYKQPHKISVKTFFFICGLHLNFR